MKSSSIKRRMSRLTYSACALLCAGGLFMSCQDDLLTGMPSWLGSSIYDELAQRGNYKTTLRLIDDPVINQHEVLAKTGSKTLFVADDDAYTRFFQNNSWGVRKYEDLSDAQKLALFNSSMVNSAYLIELLSNLPASGSANTPIEGSCMRRSTAVSIYDSVQSIPLTQLPTSAGWKSLREEYAGQPDAKVLFMRDNSAAPMVHFLPEFMTQNQITNEDVKILLNLPSGENNHKKAFINGKEVVEEVKENVSDKSGSDITCQNGYIHVLNDVMEPLTNMAEKISEDPDLSIMNSLLRRYALPVYNEANTNEYCRIHDLDAAKNKVYVWRYMNYGFDSNNPGEHSLLSTLGHLNSELLPFDPGWNGYFWGTTKTMGEDMAAIIAPTDAAFKQFENTAAGQSIMVNFNNDWNQVPDRIIVELLQNYMKESLVATVPSKFKTVTNTAKQNMGLDPGKVAKSYLCNNGVVYKYNDVPVPPEYKSVSYPVLLEDTMSIMRWALEKLQYNVYLNSMESKYTFVIPTDSALKFYIDPVDYHKYTKTVTSFYYVSKDPENDNQPNVRCTRYELNDDFTIGKKIDTDWGTGATQYGMTENEYVLNRLKDIIDNSIVIDEVNANVRGKNGVYMTKNGGAMYIADGGGSNVKLQGPFQIEQNKELKIRTGGRTGLYDMTAEGLGGNGVSFILDLQNGVKGEPLMPSSESVPALLKRLSDAGHKEYSEFYNIVANSGLCSDRCDEFTSGGQTNYRTMTNGLTLCGAMENFNYTVYVPSSESIEKLYKANLLPRPDSVLNFEENNKGILDQSVIDFKVDSMQTILDNFVRYHIQTTAIYPDNSQINATNYETTLRDGDRFTSIQVTRNGDGSLSITGNSLSGLPMTDDDGKVLYTCKSDGKVKLAREYHFRRGDDSALGDINKASKIYNSSFVAVYAIDNPLLYGEMAKKYYGK